MGIRHKITINSKHRKKRLLRDITFRFKLHNNLGNSLLGNEDI